MRRLICLIVIVGGCAHKTKTGPLVLNQHPPYEGKPGYLRCPAPQVASVHPCPGAEVAEQPKPVLTAERSQARDYSVGATKEGPAAKEDEVMEIGDDAAQRTSAAAEPAKPSGPRPVDQLRPSLPPMSKAQRLDRMRAVLAAIDAHVAGLDDQPTHEQRLMLKMSVKELRQLLETWPDVLPEADEMNEVIDKMATTLPIQQSPLRKRMNQLADLIRVQVVLAGE